MRDLNNFDRITTINVGPVKELVLDIPTDPLGILSEEVKIETGDQTMFYRVDGSGLYSLFLMVCIMGGAIMIAVSLIMLLFSRKKEALAEQKANIYHKLFIIFMACGSIFWFNALLQVGNMFIQGV